MWGQGWDLGLLRDALGRGSLLTCTKKMGRQGVGGSRFWGEEERWLAGEEPERGRPFSGFSKMERQQKGKRCQGRDRLG